MFVDEYTLLTQVIMPFLREKWDLIDIDEHEGGVGKRDGRLTKEELEAARERFTAAGDDVSAETMGELIFRYEAICQAFRDTSNAAGEADLGISPEDVSVYAKKWDPEYRAREGMPQPDNWMNPDNKTDKYW